MRPYRLGVLVVAIALLGAACSAATTTPSPTLTATSPTAASPTAVPTASGPAALIKVQLLAPFPPGLLRGGLIMAQDRYFKEQGLDVTVTVVSGSAEVSQQLIAGNALIGLLDAASILVANAKGYQERSIASFNHNVFDVVVPANSAITTVAQLKGKTIGITDLGGGEVSLVRAALTDAGLNPDTDVKLAVFADGGGPASLLALKNGTIAAFGGAINDLVALDELGFVPRSIIPAKYHNLPAGNFTVMQKSLDDPASRSIVTRVVRAYNEGLVFAEANPAAAVKIGCAQLPDQCTSLANALDEMTKGLAISVSAPGDPLGTNDQALWQTTEQTLLAGVISAPVDVTVAAPNTLIAEIDNFDANAVRAAAVAAGQ
jgi:NitT/TauT family transport system substrate-binding protein